MKASELRILALVIVVISGICYDFHVYMTGSALLVVSIIMLAAADDLASK